MTNPVHILNGDALLERFPDIEGQKIVCRECLVDGPVHAQDLGEFFSQRASFLFEAEPEAFKKYKTLSIQEFDKMQNLDSGSDVYLWFEEDLFCQINLCFVLFFLEKAAFEGKISLVLPNNEGRYAFSLMSNEQLIDSYRKAKKLSAQEQKTYVTTWLAFQSTSEEKLTSMLEENDWSSLPFLKKAIELELGRRPYGDGEVEEIIRKLSKSIGSTAFVPLFKAFATEAPQYGFGDLQVYRIWEQLDL